jgi:hypothetical protein
MGGTRRILILADAGEIAEAMKRWVERIGQEDRDGVSGFLTEFSRADHSRAERRRFMFVRVRW